MRMSVLLAPQFCTVAAITTEYVQITLDYGTAYVNLSDAEFTQYEADGFYYVPADRVRSIPQ